MRVRWISISVGVGLPLAACFPSLDGLTGAASDAAIVLSDSTAPSNDAPSSADDAGADVRDAGWAEDGPVNGDASVVVVPNGSFEVTGSGCGPGWNASNATLQTSPNARTGALACRICRLGNPGALQSASMTIPAGPGSYRLSVWLRNSSTHPTSPNIVTSLMAMQGQVGVGGQPKGAAPQADYALGQLDYTAPATTDNLVIQMQNAAGADGSCFVVDDISIERLP